MKIFSKMLKSIIQRDKGKLIRSALHYFSAVPLFRLQSNFSRSYIPLPHLVVIEPTNRCNLNCVMCARRYWDASENPLGDMTFDFFQRKVLPNLKPFQNVNLQCFGEPLVHKEFLSMLKASKYLGCWTTFTTNGVLLKEYAEDIVSIGVDKIMISIDGIETMKKTRNVKIEKVIDAIDAINEAKKNKKSKKATIRSEQCSYS